jgi:hypothetical protein
MLHEFPDAHPFARRAQLLFRGFEWRDAGLGAVRAVEVPGEEAREVLERAQEFVASDWRGVSSGELGGCRGMRR